MALLISGCAGKQATNTRKELQPLPSATDIRTFTHGDGSIEVTYVLNSDYPAFNDTFLIKNSSLNRVGRRSPSIG